MRICLFGVLAGLFIATVAYADNVVLVAGGGEEAENVAATKAKLGMPFGVEPRGLPRRSSGVDCRASVRPRGAHGTRRSSGPGHADHAGTTEATGSRAHSAVVR